MTDAVPTLTPEQQQMWNDWQRNPRGHTQRKYWTDEPQTNRAELWGNFYLACFDTGFAGGLPRQWHESFDVPLPFHKAPPTPPKKPLTPREIRVKRAFNYLCERWQRFHLHADKPMWSNTPSWWLNHYKDIKPYRAGRRAVHKKNFGIKLLDYRDYCKNRFMLGGGKPQWRRRENGFLVRCTRKWITDNRNNNTDTGCDNRAPITAQ